MRAAVGRVDERDLRVYVGRLDLDPPARARRRSAIRFAARRSASVPASLPSNEQSSR